MVVYSQWHVHRRRRIKFRGERPDDLSHGRWYDVVEERFGVHHVARFAQGSLVPKGQLCHPHRSLEMRHARLHGLGNPEPCSLVVRVSHIAG
jgi:hypothetical protein